MALARNVPESAVPTAVRELCDELAGAGYRSWIVGGCLRDLLLGRPAGDWDLATSALPADVQRVFRHTIPTGIDHGTITVLWKNQTYEVTTLRGEGAYGDGRRPDAVYFHDAIEEDLARRDFTVNAIAYDPLSGELLDPFGGLVDLERGVLRAVGEPSARFREDGLRVLRAARFVASLELDLDPATEAAIPGALDTYRKVSNERVRDEWNKTMRARSPSRAFEVMRRAGILAISCPELLEQVGCEQNQWHAFDVWTHTLLTLDACRPDPVLRTAALLHDLGKPRTRAWSEKNKDHTFYHHERLGADMADRWLRTYRYSNDERTRIVELIRLHLVCYASEWSDGAVRRFVRRTTIELLDDLLELARADAVAKGRPVEDELRGLGELRQRIEQLRAEGAAFSTRDLAVDGHDLMRELSMAPGPDLGRLLSALLERVLEEPELNTREKLLEVAAEIRHT